VASVAALPATGASGDAFLVAGDLYVWSGTGWVNGGPVLGPPGATGPAGPQGVAGPAGPAGPAGSAVAVTVATAPFALSANSAHLFTVTCEPGKKAVSGGFTYISDALVISSDSVPTDDGTGWQLYLINVDDSIGVSGGTLKVVCVS